MKKIFLSCLSALALGVFIENSEGMEREKPVISHVTSPILRDSQVPVFGSKEDIEEADLRALFDREDSAQLSRKEINLLKRYIFQMRRMLDKRIAEIPNDMTKVLLLGIPAQGKLLYCTAWLVCNFGEQMINIT